MSDYGDYRDVEQLRARLAAKDAEIARLREALQFVRPTIELQAKESPPGSSDRAALAVLDAALNGKL